MMQHHTFFLREISRGLLKMSLMITKENLENANVGSDEPKLFPDVTTQENLENANVVSDKAKMFPDHVTTQEYLDNATVVSDKPKLFPDHVTTQEYLDNATVVSNKPKLFPDHVTTQEYLDNATVVSDKPKLFPDHVTTQEYLDNATVVSDKPKLFPDHVTTQVCWKDRSQKMQLSCQKGSEDETTSTLLEGTASVNSKKKRLARKRGISEDEATPLTTSGIKKSTPSRKKGTKPAIRRPWMPEECAAIKRQLRRFFIMNMTPGKADCEKCLSEEPEALVNRDCKAVKYFVKNRSYE
ncbi:unnamed protein product [Boreogadus saida]